MHLEASQRRLVSEILARLAPGIPAYAYGSRVHGRCLKRFSDLDICLRPQALLADLRLSELRDAFSESDLPIKVDIANWHELSPEFQEAIEPALTPLN